MTAFKNEEDLYDYVGWIFETAFADPEIGPKLAETGLMLEMRCSEPDCAVVIDAVRQRVRAETADAPADAALVMTTETANRYWQGKLNLTFAIARGQIKVEGSLGKLLKLAPLSSRLFPLYIERLHSTGRQDLIIS